MKYAAKKLDEAVRGFLKSDDGEALIQRETTSPVVAFVLSIVLFLVGCFCIATIIGALKGIRLIVSVLTFEMFRKQSGPKLRKHLESLRGIIGYPVIIGLGSGRRPALVLGTFGAESPDVLADLAAKLGALYAGDAPADKSLKRTIKLLKDDQYQFDRRRLLPEPLAENRELYLFDMQLDPGLATFDSEDRPLIACAAMQGSSGTIEQIPWSVVEPVVEMESGTQAGAKRSGEVESSGVRMAMVTFGPAGKVSAKRLHADIAKTWNGLPPITEFSEHDGGMSFQLGEGSIVFQMMPGAIPWSDLDEPCGTSWIWSDASDRMKSHKLHLIVTEIGIGSALESTKLMAMIIASIIAASDDVIGVFWTQVGMVVSAEMFRDAAVESLPDALPSITCLNYRVGRDSNKKTSGFTEGLEAVGLMDIETVNCPEPPAELRKRLIGIADYLLDRGLVINDEDTLGETETERIKVRYMPSKFRKRGKVMRLDYGSK